MLTRWVREAGLEKNKSFLGGGVLLPWLLVGGVLVSWALINPAEHVGSGNVGTNQGEAQVTPPSCEMLTARDLCVLRMLMITLPFVSSATWHSCIASRVREVLATVQVSPQSSENHTAAYMG